MKPRVKVKSNIFFECCDKISAIRTSISALILLLCLTIFPVTQCADLVIRIPHDLSQQDGFYRLDYKPVYYAAHILRGL